MAVSKREKSVFEVLSAINVNKHVETKTSGGVTLSYLSWAWAWAAVKIRYPDANYEIVKFDGGVPYSYDPLTGYMVYTKVTIEGTTHEMWLPVMDSNNRAMKAEPYDVSTKNRTFTVQPATMFDVNKTIMRCLVKNLAMFGLGHYIYAGEDLPEEYYICDECGDVISDYQGNTPKQVYNATRKEFGYPMCMECATKKKKAANKTDKEKTQPAKESSEPAVSVEDVQVSEEEIANLPFPV